MIVRKSSKYTIIIDTTYRDRPKVHELEAAHIMADYYHSDIIFLRPQCQRTPDFQIGQVCWELKTPQGNSKNTIKNNLHDARPQSHNVILDLRYCKLHPNKAKARIRHYFTSHRSRIEHLTLIEKSGKVVELF